MNNPIYIAENNKDMFNIDIPKVQKGTETTESQLPLLKYLNPEVQYVLEKSSISYGILIILVICVVIIGIIIKNKRKNKYSTHTYTPNTTTNQDYEEFVANNQSNQNVYRKSAQKRGNLYTPNNINECIRKFLERTK